MTGSEYEQLTAALVDAFPTVGRLSQMTRFRLERNLAAVALGDDLGEIAFRLVGAAEAEGWIDELVLGARHSNPGNPRLHAVAERLGLAPTVVGSDLERVIRASNDFFDVERWRTRLGELEAQVCRVEIRTRAGMAYGTGFLVGPDMVMTNYHVVQPVIDGPARPSDVVLRFDYKRSSDGTTLNPGSVFHLASDSWLLDASPNSPKGQLPTSEELDYVVLRVAGSPGREPINDVSAEPGAASRGWVRVPNEPPALHANTALLILQHPQSAPLKLAIDTEAIVAVNANGTRVTYRTNTEPGSSGSPCFNANWELVALHHSGDPTHPPAYNEGIPIGAICSRLDQRGLSDLLDTAP